MFTGKHISSHNRVQAASNTTQTEWGTRPDPLRVSCRYMGPIFCHNQKFFQDVPSNLSSSHTQIVDFVSAHMKKTSPTPLPFIYFSVPALTLLTQISLQTQDPCLRACACVCVKKKGEGAWNRKTEKAHVLLKFVCPPGFHFNFLNLVTYILFFVFLSLHKFIRFFFFQKSKTTTIKGGGDYSGVSTRSRQRWCCSCTGAEDKFEISEEEGAPTGGDISQERGERLQEEGRLQEEEERQADFLCDLFIYGQPLREVGTQRRGTYLLCDRYAAASAVNVDCSPGQTVPAARHPATRSGRFCPAPFP